MRSDSKVVVATRLFTQVGDTDSADRLLSKLNQLERKQGEGGGGEGEGEASHERASEASYKNLPNCRAQRKAEQIDKIEKWQTAPGGTGQPSGAAAH